MDNFVLGKYVPYNTIIHRLDPRGKILIMIMLIVSVFLPFVSWSLTYAVSIINAINIFILMIITKVRLRDMITQLGAMWILVILLLIINIFVPPTNSVHVIGEYNNLKIYAESFLQTGKIILRLTQMIAIAMILTTTTTPQELANGFAFFLTPLRVIKFPVEEVAMTTSIALRFIPTLIEETNRIYKAQSSRGVDFKHGKIGAKFKGLISLVIPLFISSFAISDDLAYALESRGYNPRAKRTRYRELKFNARDIVALIIISIYMGLIIWLKISGYDFMAILFNQFNIKSW